jgi:hypothetical protein
MRRMKPLLVSGLAVGLCAAGAQPGAAAPTGITGQTTCPIVVFTPNSGDGLFDIHVRRISCRAARAKLRRAHGAPARLTGWRCRLAVRYKAGPTRYVCRSSVRTRGTRVERLIAYTTGN